ncbi:hypothetical protein RF11_01499 [Thelohanellus kitauei]|uniref:Uncharacterized protein n=1 Tax=Thelohanellus kitauei TaxID=669202 RepID=A0A0C2MKN1_THEKT|nr:hypothetical protein RF11_01499 [Thelohanellus kitauei]
MDDWTVEDFSILDDFSKHNTLKTVSEQQNCRIFMFLIDSLSNLKQFEAINNVDHMSNLITVINKILEAYPVFVNTITIDHIQVRLHHVLNYKSSNQIVEISKKNTA